MSTPRQYELLYIVSPEATDQELADLHGQIEAIVTRFEGRIDRTEPWGRRRLAYTIKRQREGNYVLEIMTGPGEMVRELDRRLKVIDRVMRHLIVRVDEDLRVAERRRTEREAVAARRREARGLPAEVSERVRVAGADENDVDAGEAEVE